jgi:hypothetical protein
MGIAAQAMERNTKIVNTHTSTNISGLNPQVELYTKYDACMKVWLPTSSRDENPSADEFLYTMKTHSYKK